MPLKKKNDRNPNLHTVWLYCYTNPVILVSRDYSGEHWYKEGKVSHSGFNKVTAYKNGYKTEFDVQAFRFQNVGTTKGAIDQLIRHIKANADKYPGWQHHINVYPQRGIKPPALGQQLL
jgi:hypothetical protein